MYFPTTRYSTRSTPSYADGTATTSCTEADDAYSGYAYYTETSTGYYTAEEEVFIQKKIVEYALVWTLIAYAVIWGKLVEQRCRPPPGVTNIKDFAMVELWDDRCIRVEPNTGRVMG